MKRFLTFVAVLVVTLFINLMSQNSSPQVRSFLEIVDVETGERTVVESFDFRIEAPNWTPDGKYLVYNSSGKLYKMPVAGGESELINTGIAERLNNDHILSFDGTFFAVSSSYEGSSKVFTVPFEGGEATLVTPEGPSYLHGISPDGKTLAYCARRNDNMDVYIIPKNGGEEIRLTDAEGLDDGPEFSPDGKYIWFNSVRSGLMQAWRMKADGSEQTQMTFEESNNWFPHVSPDGKKVSYISYKKGDVEPGSHPANKNVRLMIMDSEGGEPEVLVELFGGQGTLNVNSWSPDSKKFAFVSFELIEE